MLYVKLENIISEEEAVKDPQRLFNDVENNEDAWVIIRNGKPSFVIASAKLIEGEESGTGLGGFEIGVKPTGTTITETLDTPNPTSQAEIPTNSNNNQAPSSDSFTEPKSNDNSGTFYNPFNEPSINSEPLMNDANTNVEAQAQSIPVPNPTPTPEATKPLVFQTPNLDLSTPNPETTKQELPPVTDMPNDLNNTPNSTYTNRFN